MHRWLPYFEAIAVVLFIALIFLYTKRGGTNLNPASLAQAQALIEQADADFVKRDLAKALITYWHAVEAMEAAKQESSTATSELDESLLHAHLRVVEIYLHSHWSEDADAHLKRAEKIQPDHVDVHLLRGKLLRDYAEQASATQEFLAVLEKEPAHAEAHYLLGVLYQSTKQYKEAIAYYEQAIEHDSELIQLPFESAPIGLLARLQLSRTYRGILQNYRFVDRELTSEELAEVEGLEDKGITVLEEAVEKGPNFTEAKEELIDSLYRRATILERGEGDLRFYDEALNVYEHIATLDATDADAWKKIGQINFYFLQEIEAALEAYNRAYQLDPDPEILALIKNIEEDLQHGMNE
jgi:tetratricopeptide (TPR) repeat protein